MKKTALLIIMAICLTLVSCGNAQKGATYTVDFNTNSGTPVASQNVSTLASAPSTTKDGFVFYGWYTDSDFKNPVTYPMDLNRDVTLYAKWGIGTYSVEQDDCSVQFSVVDDYSFRGMYIITPTEFDLQALASLGYSIKVDVTYDVYYEKNYDVPLDIGYAGAPDHAVAIVDDYDDGELREGLSTEKEPVSESVSLVISASGLLDTGLYLKLMTYNLQNLVHYKNITVTYTVQTNG